MNYFSLDNDNTHSDYHANKTQVTEDIIPPINLRDLTALIAHLQNNCSGCTAISNSGVSAIFPTMERTISEHLTKVGIPSGLSGYRYLQSAIRKVVEDESILDGITKLLYPELAKLHNSTPQRVEKAIRHAIKTTWDNSLSHLTLDDYHFYIKKGRNYPTNSQFIAEIYRQIRLSNTF